MFRSILLLTKGLIRNQIARRKVMFWVILAALVMLFVGSVFMSDPWMRQNPWLAISYWAACAWLTLTGMLLALVDILAIRTAQRVARRILEKQLSEKLPPDEK